MKMASKDKKRPNIVFILSDDQGYWALGCAGNKEIRTPHLDDLARRGMRFENFFCTSPVCSPARASLLTGRIPSQHGVHDWIAAGNVGEDSIEYLQGMIGYTDLLAENRYVCGLSGKWHLGDSRTPQKGFSHWFVHQGGGGPYHNAPMIKNGTLYNEPRYVTEVITEEALAFIDEQSKNDDPFYLGIHYTAPHTPWINHHPQEIVDSYDDCPFESCPDEPLHPWTFEWTKEMKKNRRENLKGFFAAVTAMDMYIGQVVEKLETLGLRENTLICFMSDNGYNCGHHGIWGKGNGTFPLNMYDTSIKVPAIFSHPGRIPEGVVCEAMVSGYDFMPTLLEYVDIENTEKYKLPGKSFLKNLLGEEQEVNGEIVVFDEYGPVRMIRTRDWKYVHRYPYGPHELYHLAVDPEEKINRINDESCFPMLKELKAKLDDWFVKYADPVLDGSREGVLGGGQINLVGPRGKGNKVFLENDQ